MFVINYSQDVALEELLGARLCPTIATYHFERCLQPRLGRPRRRDARLRVPTSTPRRAGAAGRSPSRPRSPRCRSRVGRWPGADLPRAIFAAAWPRSTPRRDRDPCTAPSISQLRLPPRPAERPAARRGRRGRRTASSTCAAIRSWSSRDLRRVVSRTIFVGTGARFSQASGSSFSKRSAGVARCPGRNRASRRDLVRAAPSQVVFRRSHLPQPFDDALFDAAGRPVDPAVRRRHLAPDRPRPGSVLIITVDFIEAAAARVVVHCSHRSCALRRPWRTSATPCTSAIARAPSSRLWQGSTDRGEHREGSGRPHVCRQDDSQAPAPRFAPLFCGTLSKSHALAPFALTSSRDLDLLAATAFALSPA